jgi:EmrB/QacA subfamily drug resistance transporter
MLIPLIVACALFMQNLDSTVIATALPQIARSIGTDPLSLSLAITSYLLSLAVFIPASGWFADRYGARTVFRGAILVFTLGSILCGLSNSLAELTASRILQGVGGAMMVPVGRLVVLRSIPKAELVRAMAYLSVPALLGPVLGPPVGGFLTTYASWRWIFLLNVPIGVIGAVLVSIFIENHKDPERPPFDLAGFGLSGLALACLMFGFEALGREGLPLPAVLSLLTVGALAGAAFLFHAGRHPRPAIDIYLFRIPTFALSVWGGALFRIGVGALPFLLPLMLQLGFGLTPFASGMLTFASALGALAMKTTAAPILRRLGFRTVLVGNALISAVFLFAYGGFGPATPHAVIFALLLLGGFFRSLEFTAINTIAFADVPPPRMSQATSLSATAQQLSLSLGVTVGAGVLHLARMGRGDGALGAGDFWPAFLVVGALALIAALLFARLAPDAGAEMSGHAARGRRGSQAPAAGD